jgi:hypothetical protein
LNSDNDERKRKKKKKWKILNRRKKNDVMNDGDRRSE